MVLGALELLFEVEKGGGGPFWEFNPLFIFYLIYTFFRPICVPNQPKNAPGPYASSRCIQSRIVQQVQYVNRNALSMFKALNKGFK